MSWQISIHTFEVDRAVCFECKPHWYGPIRLMKDRAEKDRVKHYKMHMAQWLRENPD